jgi:hypothetical protein
MHVPLCSSHLANLIAHGPQVVYCAMMQMRTRIAVNVIIITALLLQQSPIADSSMCVRCGVQNVHRARLDILCVQLALLPAPDVSVRAAFCFVTSMPCRG